MKTIHAVVFAAVASTLSLSNAYGTQDIERQLILGGDVVPAGTKTYVAGLRSSPTGDSHCGGFLISATHVLSATHCVTSDIRWVSVGSHYRNGTEDGEQIRVQSVVYHPMYSDSAGVYANDFMVFELERPSKFKPVKLAAADDSDFVAGKWATAMGWGVNAEVNGTNSYELQRVDLQLVSDEACATFVPADSSMVCAGGVANVDTCFGDSGGPLILEADAASGRTEDVVVGIVSWGKDDSCGRDGWPGIYSRVSSGRNWIDSITGGNGTCLG